MTTAVPRSNHEVDITGSSKQFGNLPRLVGTIGIHRDQKVIRILLRESHRHQVCGSQTLLFRPVNQAQIGRLLGNFLQQTPRSIRGGVIDYQEVCVRAGPMRAPDPRLHVAPLIEGRSEDESARHPGTLGECHKGVSTTSTRLHTCHQKTSRCAAAGCTTSVW